MTAVGLATIGLAPAAARAGRRLLAAVELVAGALLVVTVALFLHTTRRGKFDVWADVLADAGLDGSERVLDLGCGRGAVLTAVARLLPRGHAVGVDLWTADQSGNSPDATRRNLVAEGVRERCAVTTGTMTALPFRDGSFDVILALDALEHFPDDRLAIREIRRVAKPDALVLVTVPAFQFLWSPHDVAYHHFRRYTRGELGTKLKEGGLSLQKLSYYSMTVLPPVFAMRKLRSATQGKGEAHSDFFLKLPGPIESVLYGIMRTEIGLMDAVSLPFGVSLFCAAQPNGTA